MRQGSQVSSGWEKETKKFTSSSRWLNRVSRSRLASCLLLRSSEAKTWQIISRWWSKWLSMDARPNTSCIQIAGSHRLIFPTFSDSKTCQNCNKKALRNFSKSKVELAAAVSQSHEPNIIHEERKDFIPIPPTSSLGQNRISMRDIE